LKDLPRGRPPRGGCFKRTIGDRVLETAGTVSAVMQKGVKVMARREVEVNDVTLAIGMNTEGSLSLTLKNIAGTEIRALMDRHESMSFLIAYFNTIMDAFDDLRKRRTIDLANVRKELSALEAEVNSMSELAKDVGDKASSLDSYATDLGTAFEDLETAINELEENFG